MTKVLWISRHTMTPMQLDDLRALRHDEIEVQQWSDTVRSIDQLDKAVGEADVIAAVLSLELLAELMKLANGKPVLQSVSARLDDGVGANGERKFRFVHVRWRQIKRIELEYVDL